MAVSLIDFLKASEQGALLPRVLCREPDAFFLSEFRRSLKLQGFHFKLFEVDKQGPGSDIVTESASMSLFGGGTFLWLVLKKTSKDWSKEGWCRFESLLENADGVSLGLCLEMPADKRIKEPKAKYFFEELDTSLHLPDQKKWLDRMNRHHDAKLDAARLEFLSSFEEELFTLNNWVELWSLGGDAWAKVALGWGRHSGASIVTGANPAFEWVDCVVAGRRREAHEILEQMLSHGYEPIPLCALLAKSLRIAAALPAKEDIGPQAPFLLRKLSGLNPHRSMKLLDLCAFVDRKLKSTSMDGRALMGLFAE